MSLFDWIRRLREGGRSLAELMRILDPKGDHGLERWLSGRPETYTYDVFQIPKRRGGFRTIHAPSPALADLQRRVYHKLLKELPVHEAATAYVPGRSILDNARPHAGKAVVVNLDLEDFFGSTKKEKVWEFWRAVGWGRKAALVLTEVCTLDGALPQGAPTSPALSNAVCRLLDVRLCRLAESVGGAYTRYSDDITFSFESFGSRQRWALKRAYEILAEHGYRIQRKKRIRIQRRHQRQTATGLVVNERPNLPRELRRRIRAMQHHERLGKLSPRDRRRLRGYEALQKMVRDDAKPSS